MTKPTCQKPSVAAMQNRHKSALLDSAAPQGYHSDRNHQALGGNTDKSAHLRHRAFVRDKVMGSGRCKVSDLMENSAYEVLVEEACESPWSLASMDNESSTFWTMPGEWSTFVGSSEAAVSVTVALSEQPHRCYVQKECCTDEFFLCHSGSTGQTVEITRSDVPGGWGQRLSLVCVTPALAGLSDRPQVQATGPASLVLAPRDNQSVTVMYPEKMATTMQGQLSFRLHASRLGLRGD
eukprot:s1373_g5.t1